MTLTRGIVLQPENSIDVEPGAVTLIDQSRYKSHGTITGAGYVQEPSGLWVLDFNPAMPSYIEIPATATQLDFTSEDFSLVVRLKMDIIMDPAQFIFSRGTHAENGYLLQINLGGTVLFYTNQLAASQYSDTGGIFLADVWYTIGVTRNGASVKIYSNGVDVTAISGIHINPATSAKSAKIGIHDNKINYPFDGKIEFLKIYNYALTAGQQLIEHEKVKHWFGVHD